MRAVFQNNLKHRPFLAFTLLVAESEPGETDLARTSEGLKNPVRVTL
jgi:hypothetical protein